MPRRTSKRRSSKGEAHLADDDLVGLEELTLAEDGEELDEEQRVADSIRRCVMKGDAGEFVDLLQTSMKDASSPLLFLMAWFHQWQQEYEAFVEVLEEEEAQLGTCAAAVSPAQDSTPTSATSAISNSDVVEMEAEAEQILQGFNDIAIELLVLLNIEKPDQVVDKFGWTLMMQAANSGLRGLMESLLTASDIDVNYSGSTANNVNPLYLAIQSDHTSEAMLLLKNGAAASATKLVRTPKSRVDESAEKNTENETTEEEEEEDCALFQACRLGSLIVIEEMIALGVDMNFALPSSGDRALHVAVMFDVLEVVEVLLAHDKIEINATNNSGQSCLFGCSSVEIARLLVEKGLDPRLRDAEEETAFSVADALGDEEVADYLKHFN